MFRYPDQQVIHHTESADDFNYRTKLHSSDLADFHRSMKTGCRRPALHLVNRLPALDFTKIDLSQLPPLPLTGTNRSALVRQAWGMLGNDRYGDCDFAAMGHLELLLSSADGIDPILISEADCIADYLDCNGGDVGTDPIVGCQYWQKHGLATKIDDYFKVSLTDADGPRHSIHILGGFKLGLTLQNAWQGKKLWQGPTGPVPPSGPWSPGSWDASNDAAHSIALTDILPNGNFRFCSWNDNTYEITAQAVKDYGFIGLVPLSRLWLDKQGLSPELQLNLDWLIYNASVIAGRNPLPPVPAPINVVPTPIVVPPVVPPDPVVPPIVVPPTPIPPSPIGKRAVVASWPGTFEKMAGIYELDFLVK